MRRKQQHHQFLFHQYNRRLKKYNTVFVYAILIGFFLHSGTLESDIVFFLGMIRNLIAIFLIGNWFIFPWLNKKLTT